MEKNYALSFNIYAREKLEQAISDFSDVADIILLSDEISIKGDSSEEIEEVFYEFMNYVLSL